MQRRQFTHTLGAVFSGLAVAACAKKSLGNNAASSAAGSGTIAQRLEMLEAESGGRLGVSILDAGSGIQHGYRANERFPMCSTFKMLAAALVLKRMDAGQEKLDRRIRFTAADLVVHSPATGGRTGGDGMSMAELCEASITLSDNTAANLMLRSFGGPEQLTAYARSLGDKMTRLDRIEPELNQATPGDARDTTTPGAMLSNMREIVLGSALSAASRSLISQWLLDNKTGDRRLRALLPSGWRVGDKTGSGENGSANDVGILWPPRRAPILVTAYLTNTRAPAEQRDATLAKVGQLAASLVRPT